MLGMLRKKYTVELCPEVKGQLTINGLPVKNQVVERSLTYGDEEYTDSAITDSNGHFSFNNKQLQSHFPGNILHEPIVRQAIYVDYKDDNYLLWHAYQDGTEPAVEFEQMLERIVAELTTPEKEFRIPSQTIDGKSYKIYSICNW
ncbi:hypothetical protein FLM48_17135 [Shewanella sp. Scap07]|uniref:DUF6795 domain-containing protein n=1 Tax=Shewanella sp. Scap07 TaxID=2589987 RepID=UPI0015BC0BF7|nr:DUF6795 domain-containing protein [Shewanella sp. Scap07]QLE86644.1 hypothetical protein FLM48_17135 [Shewanella sp. Scap07]